MKIKAEMKFMYLLNEKDVDNYVKELQDYAKSKDEKFKYREYDTVIYDVESKMDIENERTELKFYASGATDTVNTILYVLADVKTYLLEELEIKKVED